MFSLFFSQLFSRPREGEKVDFIRVYVLTNDFKVEKGGQNTEQFPLTEHLYQHNYNGFKGFYKIDSTYLANFLILNI